MSSDKELLELAAKAAGIGLGSWSVIADGYRRKDGGYFSPLADDGDALRLAVKLGITISTGTLTTKYALAVGDCCEVLENRRPDPYAATRRAIVRAAAEIGRQL